MFWCTNDERNEIQSTDHSVRKEVVAQQKGMKLNEIHLLIILLGRKPSLNKHKKGYTNLLDSTTAPETADLYTKNSDGGITCKRQTIRPNLGGKWKVER